VLEGGGTLEIPQRWGKDAIDLHSLVDPVHRFGEAPEGQQLVMTDIDRGKALFSLDDDPRTLKPVVSFKVPERLSKHTRQFGHTTRTGIVTRSPGRTSLVRSAWLRPAWTVPTNGGKLNRTHPLPMNANDLIGGQAKK